MVRETISDREHISYVGAAESGSGTPLTYYCRHKNWPGRQNKCPNLAVELDKVRVGVVFKTEFIDSTNISPTMGRGRYGVIEARNNWKLTTWFTCSPIKSCGRYTTNGNM